MNNQIIITTDQTGQMTSFALSERFVLYSKLGGEWAKSDFLAVEQKPRQADGIREIVKQLMNRFPDSRIILSEEISGIAYQVLNRHGYHIFESDIVEDLDGIVLEIESSQKEAQASKSIHLEPYSQNNDGCYCLDLIELQKAHPEISSKKALRRFLEEETFLQLELKCQHLPPWTQDIMAKRGLSHSIESLGGNMCRVVIGKGVCR